MEQRKDGIRWKTRGAMAGTIVILFLILTAVVLGLAGKEEKKQRKFGATYMTMNNPYFEVLDENIKEIVEGNGDILITRDPLQDQEKQNAQIRDMIDEGIDVLFLNPVDWKGIQSSLELCRKKKIPVFVMDTPVYEKELVVSTILSDNYEAGAACAKDMMRKRQSAKIVIVYSQNINSTSERVKGFLDTIREHPEYQVVAKKNGAAELEVGMREMKKIINEGITFDVVLGGNDPTALGCIAAMQKMNKEEGVMVYGIDGSPDAKAMIKAGYMEATSAQSPVRIGMKAAETAYEYLDGKPVEQEIKIPVTLITRDNMKNYSISGWQ
ncbi:sugar ABC transporter substrate-binding protein [Suipraeoptans intestinalis]|uniref:sugar ABC transporter substrate-binding protein n=1 Tax=Suipraeoptans intestinalis TaxID=2606628 RepID=UPI002A74FB05|nr:sugar ABC transporter substrate-binding protein [Suipraeoptans intestinalis]MDY3122396.1 sugar ABC transporter substrate-binding protein [Suipraeoptans intestinalis]